MTNLNEIKNAIVMGKEFSHENALKFMIGIYKEAATFVQSLTKDKAIHEISETLETLSKHLQMLGELKSISETMLEIKISKEDETWRKTNLTDYKQSSKSSTTHQTNLRGLPTVAPYSLACKLFTSLYFDINNIIKSYMGIASNLKFEIEKGFLDYTIKR